MASANIGSYPNGEELEMPFFEVGGGTRLSYEDYSAGAPLVKPGMVVAAPTPATLVERAFVM